MADDPNLILWRTSDPLFYTAYDQAMNVVQESIATLNYALDSDSEGPFYLQAQKPVSAPEPDHS